MSKKRRMFDIDLPDDAVAAAADPFPAGKIAEPPARRGPMATAIAETAETARDRAEVEARIRAENDALAHEHMRLKRLGLVMDLVPLDRIDMFLLVRDRKKGPDADLRELKESIIEVGLSNPIRVQDRGTGRFELVQGYRRLNAYKELLEDTGDAERFGAIPAVVGPQGDALEALYRRMVDENLVRKDISFAEMAQLALDYSADPQIGGNDPEKAVAKLFKSASYPKRSYIRSFITIIEMLGQDLGYLEAIPRDLGTALARRLESDSSLARAIRAALKDWETRSVDQELDVLRRFVGQGAEARAARDAAADQPAPPPPAFAEAPARAKTSFQFDRREGRAKCVAAVGKLEIQLDRDFTTIDRRRLEQAVRAMLDQLDG